MKNNNKGFTIIEMTTLIAIIGTLVLLAVPKFNGIIGKAETINISNDLNVMEMVVLTNIMKNNSLPIDEGQKPMEIAELEEKLMNNMIFDKQGTVSLEDLDMNKNFYILNKDFIEAQTTSRLQGDFILNNDGQVLYINMEQSLASNSLGLEGMLESIKEKI